MFRSKEDTDVTESLVDKRFRLLLEVGSKTPADSDAEKLNLPDYYDADKFRQGQSIFYNNMFAVMVAKLCGLVTLLSIPSILDILILTKQSGTPCTAFRRYAATVLHTCIWYEKNPEGENKFFIIIMYVIINWTIIPRLDFANAIQNFLSPPANAIYTLRICPLFFASLKNVRTKHCVASKKSLAAGLNRISQLDMALTQFGFIGFTLLCGEDLGIVASTEDIEGLVHVWRVIGSLLGIEERFNICSGTVEETKALCGRLLDEVFLPKLASRDPKFEEMRHVLLEGMWSIDPIIDPAAFTAITIHMATSATSNNNHSLVTDTSSMSAYSRFLFNFQLFLHRTLLNSSKWWSKILRPYFNARMRFHVFLTEHFPFLAYWCFGKQRSHFNIYKMHLE